MDSYFLLGDEADLQPNWASGVAKKVTLLLGTGEQLYGCFVACPKQVLCRKQDGCCSYD